MFHGSEPPYIVTNRSLQVETLTGYAKGQTMTLREHSSLSYRVVINSVP
jgi:hypothetical protein